MALVVFIRGINAGGHRRVRPSVVARELCSHDVVNVGAAGTFVVWRPGPRGEFLAELRGKLPFAATIACCEGRELVRLGLENPFGSESAEPGAVRFVSILSRTTQRRVALPADLPGDGEWLVRILGARKRLVYGVYRRQMKTIGCLGEIDRLFGAPATTRNWNTIAAVLRILKRHDRGAR